MKNYDKRKLQAMAESISTVEMIKTVNQGKFKFDKPKDEIDKALQAFLTGDTSGQFGRYLITGSMLVYRLACLETINIEVDGYDERRTRELKRLKDTIEKIESGTCFPESHTVAELKEYLTKVESGEDLDWTYERSFRKFKYREMKANLIAQRVGTNYIGNSSVLGLIGRTVSFGNEALNREETEIQKRLSALIPMIPFNVFYEAKLDLNKYKLVDRGSEETVTRAVQKGYDKKTNKPIMVDENVHFTGASLFTVDGTCFLFDIDREEINHKIFNPFLVEIPVPVTTIADAYQALKPMEVLNAEKQGKEILRQGEWFFIESDVVEPKAIANERSDWHGDINENVLYGEYTEKEFSTHNTRSFELRAGDNRPNNAAMGFLRDGNVYVKGIVTHSGREHRPVVLKQWFQAVPNTATKSFTIVGDID